MSKRPVSSGKVGTKTRGNEKERAAPSHSIGTSGRKGMAALKLLQKNRGSSPQKHIDNLRSSVDIQIKPVKTVKKRVRIKPTPEAQPPEPKSPLEKPRRKPKRSVDIQNITTSKDMYGPDGPNAVL